ncbi:hypothetical protein HMN09_00287400 [Mycena chlorophos]|uniref:Uncharacterized protein n=1 Tax=Mycena chlorophos TaxID=658473 RepID=A0A8H6WJP9_MYCCL|nr:hypothetical protein HMN09_00287400 [Mycena chlorophos]
MTSSSLRVELPPIPSMKASTRPRAVSTRGLPPVDTTNFHFRTASFPEEPRKSTSGRSRVRPLPRIPQPGGPMSAGTLWQPQPPFSPPPPRRATSHLNLRPLPALPEAIPPLNTGSSLQRHATTAAPKPQTAPKPRARVTMPPPSRPETFGPRKFASLTLRLQLPPTPRTEDPPLPLPSIEITPIDADFDITSLPPTPVDAAPAPPSPNSVHHRRMSKLRRHLGESVQLDIFGPEGGKRHEAEVYQQTIIAVKRLLDLESPDRDDESSDSDSDDEQYALMLTAGNMQCQVPVKRYSRKWVREKGGKRWVEENYADLLRDLRAL